DEQGVARIAGLRPGRAYAHALRGETGGDAEWADVTIVAGKEVEATLTLGPGMNVSGAVVDAHDLPVEGAEIVVADWGGGGGFPLGHSAAAGSFRLRAVGTHTHIGARAPGFEPSPMRQFTASAGAETTLRIVLAAGGAELMGIVLGPLDTALAGALVRIGDDE